VAVGLLVVLHAQESATMRFAAYGSTVIASLAPLQL
jgi:hypothetical protein